MIIIFTIVVLTLIPIFIDLHVSGSTRSFLYTDRNALPEVMAGLVPGTSRKLRNGRPNRYYTYRMDAAEALFKAGKIKYLIVSGSSDSSGYNEPEEMKIDLVSRGIPAAAIKKDPTGLRTMNSIQYMQREKSGSVIIISQKFHNERAVYISRKMGIEAWGFNARDVSFKAGIKTRTREIFARTKMFFELIIK
ncbi:MAG: YdcF family protein [Spirochaetales bacterium]|nr:YdcF family protein [Spirochaetales bacterium]